MVLGGLRLVGLRLRIGDFQDVRPVSSRRTSAATCLLLQSCNDVCNKTVDAQLPSRLRTGQVKQDLFWVIDKPTDSTRVLGKQPRRTGRRRPRVVDRMGAVGLILGRQDASSRR